MYAFPVFENFLLTKCGLIINRARGETVGFFNKFTAIFATHDVDIDDFVKNMHALNSARP